MAVSWVVTTCSLVEVHKSISESLINAHQTTQRYNPDDGHPPIRCNENLKFCIIELQFKPTGWAYDLKKKYRVVQSTN